ncbi:vacuolar protein sorting-associated protein 54, chloroplastic [Oryza glaberrima]|uniref:vacuolar protein sorting-associated protein 54, chloroplastic n=1 Tax=Oryza glaberrima TaxID=4538 RepID=UPI00224C3BFC|nr:vacuolar protein sorting-associated protein 54, chloroplastic [Oryza glaberrima]XP_052152000.1 vacuolar protein sorting-associated protein 54, chloroplastic [Oryza glaberrima]
MASRPPLRTTSASSSTLSTDSPTSAPPGGVPQSITALLNNPLPSASSSSYYWLTWPPPTPLPDAPPPPPPHPCDVSRADFAPYLAAVADPFARFADIRLHASAEELAESQDGAAAGPAASGLAACLREVPALFFKEDFALEDGATFKAACPLGDAALQERLGQHLDVVEAHLVREIARRSESFYEAQGRLRGLDGEIVAAVGRIRELREVVRVLTGDLVGAARQVQELNATRGNLVALQQKLTVILYVSQALAALKLLVAAADCAGALDVIDDLQNLLDTDELTGLYCFRNIRDQLGTSLDSVNSILSAEFVRAAVPDGKAVDALIQANVKRKASVPLNGTEHEVNIDEEESFILRDRLLPLIICLLRTDKLPAVLRIYRDTLITVMKASIKATVAELLPILVARTIDSDSVTGDRAADSDAGGQSLANKLRSLSSEGFVQLLSAIFRIVQVHLVQAAEVKRIVEWIMGNLEGSLSSDASNSVQKHSGSVSDFSQENDYGVTSRVSNTLTRSNSKFPFFQGKTNDMSSTNSIKNVRADVLRENTEAVFAACDAAHGRWAKLLGVRAALHPKLRLQEFLIIYNVTEEFVAATEKIGGRLGYNIRGIVQQQSKQFVDYQHTVRMAKIKAVLDQETWVAVDVPEEFQAIVLSLSSTYSVANGMEMPSTDDSSKLRENRVTSQEPVNSAENNTDNGNAVSTSPSTENNIGHARSTQQTIVHGGVGYHMVNCGLILLKMLSEYVDISKCLPSLSFEVVQRVVEILKLFNTRTCQLVLGAGAMQVSGLKSITSKHLALASQIISFIYSLIPDIRRVLFLKIPEARKQLLMSELDRMTQDYKIHRDEIHTKLVQIMRERLLANLRKLPQIVESWNGPEDTDLQPSQFAKAVTKEVSYLHRILSQTLLEADVQLIFRQVVQIFHSHITEAFSKLELSTPQAKNRLCRDVQHILVCIRKLPAENFSAEAIPNYGLLDDFLAEKFGTKVDE